MPATCKVLLLEDDEDVLDLHREMFSRLPSEPEILAASSGARAIALLEAEPFSLLVTDLKAPAADGLQLLSIIRKKFPQLRTAIITGAQDPQARSKAYSLGIDLFLPKPSTHKEIVSLLDCLEALLNREENSFYRGVAKKNLAEVIQVEALSKNSTALRVRGDAREGVVWLERGEIVDATFENLEGEEAFRKILNLQTDSFEIVSAEAGRPRRIQRPVAALLEEFGGATRAGSQEAVALSDRRGREERGPKLAKLQGAHGVEFALLVPAEKKEPVEKLGIEDCEAMVKWLRKTVATFQNLGLEGNWGPLMDFEASGAQQQVRAVVNSDYTLAAGMDPSISREEAARNLEEIIEQWAS